MQNDLQIMQKKKKKISKLENWVGVNYWLSSSFVVWTHFPLVTNTDLPAAIPLP